MIFIDTCIVVALRGGEATTDQARAWFQGVRGEIWFSTVAMSEIMAGCSTESEADEVGAWCVTTLRLAAFDAPAAMLGGRMTAAAGGVADVARLIREGTSLKQSAAKQVVRTDTAILATAMHHANGELITFDGPMKKLAERFKCGARVRDLPATQLPLSPSMMALPPARKKG